MRKSNRDNVFDVLGMGPIVFGNAEMGVLITVNGVYLNWWNGSDEDGWHNSDCRPTDSINGLYDLSVADAMVKAEQWYNEVMNALDDENADV